MAQNYQPPKWMVFLLNMIISVGHWYHNFEPNPDMHMRCICTNAPTGQLAPFPTSVHKLIVIVPANLRSSTAPPMLNLKATG